MTPSASLLACHDDFTTAAAKVNAVTTVGLMV
jgi:hypothetical protein